MIMKNNPSFCSLLWNGLTINANGVVRPCCRFNTVESTIQSLEEEKLISTYNSDLFKDIRNSMLNGEKVDACKRCYTEEQAGIKSLRLDRQNLKNVDLSDDKTTLNKIEFLEVFTGKECNLACLTCKPLLSSKWDSEVSKLGWKQELVDLGWSNTTPNFNAKNLSLEKFNNLKEIKFVGGETLINDAHLNILKTIPNPLRQNITLDYFTNGTFRISDQLFKFWSQFNRVKVRFSIDGYKQVNNYIRFPSKWELVEQNIKSAISKKRVNIDFRIHSTISILNVFSYEKIDKWWQELTKSNPNIVEPVKHNLLHDPSFMSIGILKNIPATTNQLNLPDNWLRIVSHSKLDEEDIFKLNSFLCDLDKHRGLNYREVIPELTQIFTTNNKKQGKSV